MFWHIFTGGQTWSLISQNFRNNSASRHQQNWRGRLQGWSISILPVIWASFFNSYRIKRKIRV